MTFGYGGQKVLEDVSFTIPQGSTFAILGGTGSGKSTLVHLLDRLYEPDEGSGAITIGGRNIQAFRRDCLRKQIGLVLQEPFLFSRTIRENIAVTCPDAPEKEVREAASVACVDEAITEFPEGYDTVIGERGSRFLNIQFRLLSSSYCFCRPSRSVLSQDTSSVSNVVRRYGRSLFQTFICCSMAAELPLFRPV